MSGGEAVPRGSVSLGVVGPARGTDAGPVALERGRCMRFADLIDRAVVAGMACEVEPRFVAAADAVADGLREPAGFAPDDLRAQDQTEFVDAAQGVAPGQ